MRDETRLRAAVRPKARVPLSLLWGALLVAGGVLLFLEVLGVLTDGRFFWAGTFAVVATVFAAAFLLRAEAWWAAITAGALSGLAVLSGIGDAGGSVTEAVGGGAFLALLGAGFWAVYLRETTRWWAIIPGGVLLTLGGTGALDALDVPGDLQGGAFFLGLGLTFLLVGLLPAGAARRRWAFIPGGVLAVMGLLIAAGAGAVLDALEYLWPVALIAAGLYLLWRATRGHWPRAR